MTTISPPIDTFQDILDALAREPRLQDAMRQHVLDREFQQLPAIVRELAQGQTELQRMVAQNTAAIARNTEAIARNTEAIAQNSRDIAELREIVAQNSRDIAELREAVARNTEAIAQNSRDIAELREAVARNTEAIAQNSRDIAELREAVAQNSRDIAELREIVAQNSRDIADLKEAVARNTEAIAQNSRDIAELREAVAQNSRDIAANTKSIADNSQYLIDLSKVVARLAENYASMSGKVDNLNGTRYEQQVANIASRYVRRALGLTDAKVSHRGWRHGDLMEQVANSERLTDPEAEDLVNVDVIISGQLADGAASHAVGEISLTIQERDVRRAHRRAQLVQTALGDAAVVHSVTFGDTFEDDAVALAQSIGVHTIVARDYGAESDRY